MIAPVHRRSALAACAIAFAACSGSSGPDAGPLPAFVFTSDDGGPRGISLHDSGAVTRLSAAGDEDTQPHSAAGSIVFRSRRDGNGEIYIASTALLGQTRLTEDPWDDAEPALSPDGASVLFVSNRSGAPRIWVMDADGTNQRAIPTGSSSFVPEGAPAWRPSGDEIAFTSTRTGTSQVFVLPLAGGSAEQVTHEATGAFLPAWTGDGSSIAYTTREGGSTVRVVSRAGGDWRALAAGDALLSDASCAAQWCLVVSAASGEGNADILGVSRPGRAARPVFTTPADDREPAFLVR